MMHQTQATEEDLALEACEFWSGISELEVWNLLGFKFCFLHTAHLTLHLASHRNPIFRIPLFLLLNRPSVFILPNVDAALRCMGTGFLSTQLRFVRRCAY